MKVLKYGFVLAAFFSTAAFSEVNKLECLYVIDGVDHVAKVDLSDSTEEPGYKYLKIVNNGDNCENYVSGAPSVVNGKRYLKYMMECGDELGVFSLYKSRQDDSWSLTRTFDLIGRPFTMDYSCQECR